MFYLRFGLIVFTVVNAVPGLWAAIVLPDLFVDNMVLQHGKKIRIWGKASDEKSVTITFNGKSVVAQVQDGKWQVFLEPMKPGGPYELLISGASQVVKLTNILIGDVYFAAGQSNMARVIYNEKHGFLIQDYERHIAEATNALIRLCFIRATTRVDERMGQSWVICRSNDAAGYSAIPYLFAKHLYSHLKIPVGVIVNAWGGTKIESWLDERSSRQDLELATFCERQSAVLKEGDRNKPGLLYKSMASRAIPYTINGFLWYQGESNCKDDRNIYEKMLRKLIGSWRDDWEDQGLPFFLVQPPPAPSKDWDYRGVWQSQRSIFLSEKNVRLITTSDVRQDTGDIDKDIHPSNKEPIGMRLAGAAAAFHYGRKVGYTGPILKSAIQKDGHLVLSFDYAEGGLLFKGEKLESLKWVTPTLERNVVPSELSIESNTLLIETRGEKVKAVSYAWEPYSTNANLFNSENFPALPFHQEL